MGYDHDCNIFRRSPVSTVTGASPTRIDLIHAAGDPPTHHHTGIPLRKTFIDGRLPSAIRMKVAFHD
jgi:hypothetical protein